MIYWISILLVGAPGGFYAAINAMGGFPSQLGFTLLAICWFSFTLVALLAIKRGETQRHQKWMIRSYAITYAAVALRLYLPLFTGAFGMPFMEAYVAIAWLCWVPNLFVAEWIIRATLKPGA